MSISANRSTSALRYKLVSLININMASQTNNTAEGHNVILHCRVTLMKS